MAKTNFAALDDPAKTVWSRDVWEQARDMSFTAKFMGTSSNSMIHRVTELTKTERGDSAIINLVPDMAEDGIVGDNEFGNDTVALKSTQDKVVIDQLRQAIKNTGRMSDQKSVINFREQARDQLSYWLSDRMDQMTFMTLAGYSFANNTDGSVRADQGTNNLSDLAFNPTGMSATAGRHVRVLADGSLDDGNTAVMAAADTLSYKAIVRLQTLVKTRYLRGIRGAGGSEEFHLFVHPEALASLKVEQDFIDNQRHAGVRGDSNSLFAGGDSYKVDGLYIHTHRHVPTTLGTATKWGAGTNVEGCTGLLCGAQAMGFIDLDAPIWDERDHFDFGNYFAIAYGKIFGMKKMQFKHAKKSTAAEGLEDYGVIRVDMAI